MPTCTWNLIFLSFNIKDEYINKKENDGISIGIRKFEEDVYASPFCKDVNIFKFEFISDSNRVEETSLGKYSSYRNKKGEDGNNIFEELLKDNFFDSHKPECFKEYFNSTISNDTNQKYFIVFLAHSFGPGFFEIRSSTDFLKMQDLAWAFENSFKKVDGFFALNCQMQSLESNFALRNSVEFLIGSQQPLYPDTISYSDFLDSLIRDTKKQEGDFLFKLSNQMLFQKFVFNNHNTFNANTYSSYLTSSPFCLTITKPATSKLILAYLNILFAYFYRDQIDNQLNKKLKQFFRKDRVSEQAYKNLSIAILFCEDPSNSNLFNIIDANSFFNKLKEMFDYQNHHFLSRCVDLLLKYMNNLIICHLASGNSFQKVKHGKIVSYFYPMGIGLFIVKNSSSHGRETLNIFQSLLQNKMEYYSNNLESVIGDISSTVTNGGSVDLITRIKNTFFGRFRP